MLDQLLADVKAAILTRNPALGPYLSPGVAPDVIRRALKRAGISGDVEAVVAVFSRFDGASCPQGNEAWRLGFAPPVVKTIQLPAETVQMLAAIGKKVDPHQTIYGTFYFPRWDGVVYSLKTWRKFASNPRNGMLVGRVVPFFVYGETQQELALEVDQVGTTRIISIQTEHMKDAPPLTQAYESLEAFLQDLIEANRDNRPLAWPARLGPPIELQLPSASQAAAKPTKTTLPVTEKVLLVRTDFSSDMRWQSLQDALAKMNLDSSLALEFVSDPTLGGLTAKQLIKKIPNGHSLPIALLADAETFATDETSVLVIDLLDKPGQSFRTKPACLHEVYDNLSVANMDFTEFVKAAKADGVYRGSER